MDAKQRRMGLCAMPFRLCDSENREAGVLVTLTRSSYLLNSNEQANQVNRGDSHYGTTNCAL
jgi:hypothetical protein